MDACRERTTRLSLGTRTMPTSPACREEALIRQTGFVEADCPLARTFLEGGVVDTDAERAHEVAAEVADLSLQPPWPFRERQFASGGREAQYRDAV